jgi:anti-sigma factor RsiW
MNREHWQNAIDDLLDGNLSAEEAKALREEAARDAQLAKAIIDAYQVQNELESLGMEQAPESLQKSLRAIPSQQRNYRPAMRWAGALAGSAAAVLMVIGINQDMKEPSAAEIAEARAELAVAFSYLNTIGQKAGLEMKQEISGTMQDALLTGIREGVSNKQETS